MIDENCRQTGVARREFLVYSGTAALCLASSPILARRAWGTAGKEYYSANRERFVASFEGTVSSAQAYLTAKYDSDKAGTICGDARAEFGRLLPDLPFIGGDSHPGTKWILLAGHWCCPAHYFD